ncbi:MAG: hypothetical protein ACLSVX_13615 [Massilimicrobiota timonensis]
MKTLSYYLSTIEEIEVGNIYYFGQLVEGDGDLDELLFSRSVAIYDETEDDHKIVDFEIVEEDTDILKTKVKVIDIF